MTASRRGVVAVAIAAAALGVAATATYGVALLERGFEVFDAPRQIIDTMRGCRRLLHEQPRPHGRSPALSRLRAKG